VRAGCGKAASKVADATLLARLLRCGAARRVSLLIVGAIQTVKEAAVMIEREIEIEVRSFSLVDTDGDTRFCGAPGKPLSRLAVRPVLSVAGTDIEGSDRRHVLHFVILATTGVSKLAE
jgi:hypothetical protein